MLSQDGTVEETNDYYPFGGLLSSSTSAANSVQPYKYNGKELDRHSGLDWYDYGARWYDAVLGRWGSVDPLAESYSGLSPYDYCGNNPVVNVDPNGTFSTKFGAWLYRLFHGGDQILKDKGGEYFVSRQVEHTGDEAGITVERTFDWNNRNYGRNLELENQWNAYIAAIEFQDLVEKHGMEYVRVESRSEAIADMLKPVSLTVMPSPLLKSGNLLIKPKDVLPYQQRPL